MYVLEAVDLIKQYKNDGVTVNAVNGISLSIHAGEFVSIMGPSGCGKSTLLYMMGGLDAPTQGRVFIDGEDINKMNDIKKSNVRRRKVGFIFQFYNLVQNLTVRENVILPAIMDGQKKKSCLTRSQELLDVLGLSDLAERYPAQLSGGQQQRVAIARAVFIQPKIILADEPTGNLDSASREKIMQLFVEINSRYGITILQVTHDNEMASYGKRIVNMIDGKIISDQAREGDRDAEEKHIAQI